MSLVEYRQAVREKLGLKEEDPAMSSGGDTGMDSGEMGGMSGMDEATLNSVLELVQKEILKREAVGEVEGMEDPAAKTVAPPEAGTAPAGQPPVAAEPGASVTLEAEQVADDIYFEMLNSFKNNIANCDDASRKEMYRKGYNHLYKMREKFIKEMTACEEQPTAPGTPGATQTR